MSQRQQQEHCDTTPWKEWPHQSITCRRCGKEGHYSRSISWVCCTSPYRSGKWQPLITRGQVDGVDNKATPNNPASQNATPVLPVSPTAAYKVEALINDNPVSLILDTGAASSDQEYMAPREAGFVRTLTKNLVGVDGTAIRMLGCPHNWIKSYSVQTLSLQMVSQQMAYWGWISWNLTVLSILAYLVNPGGEPIIVHKGTKIGVL